MTTIPGFEGVENGQLRESERVREREEMAVKLTLCVSCVLIPQTQYGERGNT
jgi:hypothetical protein